jgi:DNA-binding LacI/PurR family transcriptional regulator
MNMMAGVFRYLQERKIRVPDDISIAGYRGEDFNSLFTKSVTRIKIGERNIGRVAARLLYDILNNLVGSRMDITLSTELVIGETCKKLE